MDSFDLPAPRGVPPDLARPSGRYRMLVGLVVASLLLFCAFYLGLALVAVDHLRMVVETLRGGSSRAGFALVSSPIVALLLLFLGSGLLAVRRGRMGAALEITAAEQPRLFAFVHDIADRVGAPRPHRVYVTPEVNAAVAFDASLRDLVLPRRKNLVIGLGLVNVLTLDELKAVLAHEFGHFSQSSMRLGRYAYVANGVIGRLVSERNGLDGLVQGLARIDLRIGWIGWVGMVVFWAIRRALGGLFWVINVPERALSREMELHADKVAVSLTGSDSLVHALSRLGAGDAALAEALSELRDRARHGSYARDLYALHGEVLRLAAERGDAVETPERPEPPDPAFRVFESDAAPPPQMWASHPPNRVREDHAKRPYLPSHLDDRPAWALFAAPEALRERVTELVNREWLGMPADAKASDAPVAAPLGARGLQSRFGGLYAAAPVTLSVARADALLSEPPSGATFEARYDDGLKAMLDLRRSRIRELQTLLEVARGERDFPAAGLPFRGGVVRAAELRRVAESVRDELAALDASVADAMVRIRRVVHAEARARGAEWERACADATRLLHFVEHQRADTGRARARLVEFLQRASRGTFTDGQIPRLLEEAYAIWRALDAVLGRAAAVRCPAAALPTDLTGLRAALLSGEIVHAPNPRVWEAHWMGAFAEQVDGVFEAWDAVRRSALDHLLFLEDALDADVAAPELEPVELPDFEAVAQEPSAGARGIVVPTLALRRTATSQGARVAADLGFAAALLVGLVGARLFVGSFDVLVYNGTERTVTAVVGARAVDVPPGMTATVWRFWPGPARISARVDGVEIGAHDVVFGLGGTRWVYNVARRGIFVEYQVVYSERGDTGPTAEPRVLGNPALFETRVDYALREPPESIEASGTTRRTALQAIPDLTQRDAIELLRERIDDEAAAAWAEGVLVASAPTTIDSFVLEAIPEARRRELATRLRDLHPAEVAAHRLYQDAVGHDAVRETYAERARAQPDADALYLAGRVHADPEGGLAGYDAALALDPEHRWALCARAWTLSDLGRYAEAGPAVERCAARVPERASELVVQRVLLARANGERGWSGRAVSVVEAARERPETTALCAWLEAALRAESDPAAALPDMGELRDRRLGVRLVTGDVVGVGAVAPEGRDAFYVLLAALSDGGDRGRLAELVGRLPAERNESALWAAVAARMLDAPAREAADARLREAFPDEADRLLTALELDPSDLGALEASVRGLAVPFQGFVYAAAAVRAGPARSPELAARARGLTLPGEAPWLAP